jgi:N-acetylglutamate synthase-like GNAT family acetyltransferase
VKNFFKKNKFDLNLVEISHEKDISPIVVQNVYSSVGWQYRNVQDIEKSMKNSFLVTSAKYKNEIIGVARATGDGIFNATIWDLAVKPYYQKKGVGTLIIKSMLNKLSEFDIPLVTLYTSYTKKCFYSKLGFNHNVSGVLGMFIKNRQYK